MNIFKKFVAGMSGVPSPKIKENSALRKLLNDEPKRQKSEKNYKSTAPLKENFNHGK